MRVSYLNMPIYMHGITYVSIFKQVGSALDRLQSNKIYVDGKNVSINVVITLMLKNKDYLCTAIRKQDA